MSDYVCIPVELTNGIALHYCSVVHGKLCFGQRPDFTVIGKDANWASRPPINARISTIRVDVDACRRTGARAGPQVQRYGMAALKDKLRVSETALKFDPRLCLEARTERVLDHGHVGDQIRGVHQRTLGVATGNDDVQVRAFVLQSLDHLVDRQIVVA